jgi:hypothetical protein
MLGYIAARTGRLLLSTATTLITTNDPTGELADQMERRPARPVADPFALTRSFEQHLAGD